SQLPVLNYFIHDYGGQSEFKINHAMSLASPESVYVIVLPLFDMEQGRPIASLDACEPKLLEWLQFVYSVMHVDELSIDSFYDEDADLEAAAGEKGEQSSASTIRSVPIVVVINKFSQLTRAAGWTDETVLAQARRWIAAAEERFNADVKGG